MRAVTKYIATDGSEWGTEAECVHRDELDAVVRGIERALGPRVDRGRRAVNPSTVALAKVAVVDLCRTELPRQDVFQHPADKIHPMSYAGRVLSEVGGPLNRIWMRFACINGEWEYEQPFFALNPHEFKESEFQRVD